MSGWPRGVGSEALSVAPVTELCSPQVAGVTVMTLHSDAPDENAKQVVEWMADLASGGRASSGRKKRLPLARPPLAPRRRQYASTDPARQAAHRRSRRSSAVLACTTDHRTTGLHDRRPTMSLREDVETICGLLGIDVDAGAHARVRGS